MTRAEELEMQIIELRERYDAVVEKRIEYLTMTGAFDSYSPKSCNDDAYEIEAIEDWIEELRNELKELKPEKFGYGKRLKQSSSIVLGREFSWYGDNGHFICRECRGLFECDSNDREDHSESFECCKEHKGRKSIGKMILRVEDLL